MNKLRIIHIIGKAGMGGIGSVVSQLILEQQKQGHTIELVCFQKGGEYIDLLVKSNIPIHFSHFKSGFHFKPSEIKRLQQLCLSCDVIHSHIFTPLLHPILKLVKNKVVYTMHGLSQGNKKRNPVVFKVEEFLKKRYLNKCVQVLCANSNFILSKVLKQYKLKRISSKVIYNGLFDTNASDVKNENLKLPEMGGKFVIGIVARLTKQKRIDTLIHIIANIPEKEKILLLVVGEGSERLFLEHYRFKILS
jgi:glycosyltransferase involved in cell wall biosynthesis